MNNKKIQIYKILPADCFTRIAFFLLIKLKIRNARRFNDNHISFLFLFYKCINKKIVF